MVSNSNLTVIFLLLCFFIVSCKKEVKTTRIQIVEYKSDMPIEGADVSFAHVTQGSVPLYNVDTYFEGKTDANGYCNVPNTAIAHSDVVSIASPNYYVFSKGYYDSATVFKLDLIGNIKIHLVDTAGNGMVCQLYVYPERPISAYGVLIENWDLRVLPWGPIPPDYNIVSPAYGGQINKLQILRGSADTINTFADVSRTDTTLVEIKY